jgi:hypothetical protein
MPAIWAKESGVNACYNPAMVTSDLSTFRITLFYGPEAVEDQPSIQNCVYNVKKRSWKGGIQVAVEIDDAQLSRARASIDFERWLRPHLTGVSAERVAWRQPDGPASSPLPALAHNVPDAAGKCGSSCSTCLGFSGLDTTSCIWTL